MTFELKYRPDVLKTLRVIKMNRNANIIVDEFLKSEADYVRLDYKSCGCRPKSKVANLNRYTFRHDIAVKAIMVGDECYIVKEDENEKQYRREISKLHKGNLENR